MTKKKKEQVKSVVITEDDNGFHMNWEEGSLSSSEVLGMLEYAKLSLQAQVLYHYQTRFARQQKEAK